jgi:predicted MFS family arabinose efflux permease
MLKSLSREQKYMLLVLTLINFFNYVDRQVIFPLFHDIQLEFHVSDTQLGLLGTVFMLVHSLSSVPLGIIADKYRRRRDLISGGVSFWSIMSFMTGLATSFPMLLGTRSLVGIGEASYGPAATAMISDNFPQRLRARAQGIFNVGMFAGGTIGAVAGGIIAYHFSWRHAFLFISLPGVLLAWLSTKIKEDFQVEDTEKRVSFLDLLKNKAFFWIITSGTLVTFAVGGYIAWGVEFARRYKGYNIEQASIVLGSIMLVSGILGVFLGSVVADRLQKRFVWGRSLTIGASFLFAFPLMYYGIHADGSRLAFLVSFFFGTMFLSCYHGPVTAVLHDVVPKHSRATAFAFYVLIIHLLGDTPGPAVVGRLSDAYSLRYGLEIVTFLVLLSGLASLMISKVIKDKKVEMYLD